VGSVAERLIPGTSAPTEIVFPTLFKLDALGFECCNDWLCHVSSLPDGIYTCCIGVVNA
jgi:hypothetical protein